MYLTKEKALEEHRKMWKAMKEELGDCPDWGARYDFKDDWCKRNFKYEDIEANCFLCEYARNSGIDCSKCPIDWSSLALKPYGEDIATCCDTYKGGNGKIYCSAPISDILNLPNNNESE